jgi:flavin-dependent dehydrogenase
LKLTRPVYDLAIAGAGFAGLSAAAAAAARGLRVAVLEAKSRSGSRVHTTGILVKEASDEFDIPGALTRKLHGVRLYAPNLEHVDLLAAGNYFLATDTDALLDWMALQARALGATILTGSRFKTAEIRHGTVVLEPLGVEARFVIGADGARSQVAEAFNLGRNRHFLTGVEAEYRSEETRDDFVHCFLDSDLAPGYLGWMVPGVGIRQIGLARSGAAKPNLPAFLDRIAPIFGPSEEAAIEFRAGLIPCGGLVQPFASSHALLVGDAAGLVSPLTGGGIHRALHFGRRAAVAVCDYLEDGGPHPGLVMSGEYPTFRLKRLLRRTFEFAPMDAVYNAVLGRRSFQTLARSIFFNTHRAGAKRDLDTPSKAETAYLNAA